MDKQAPKVDSEYKNISHASRYTLAFRALSDESKTLQNLTRYETTHRRAYYKALDTLLQLRAASKLIPGAPQSTAQPPAQVPVQPDPEPAPQAPAEQNQNVSQTPNDKENFCETNPRKEEKAAVNDENSLSETTTKGENTEIRPAQCDGDAVQRDNGPAQGANGPAQRDKIV